MGASVSAGPLARAAAQKRLPPELLALHQMAGGQHAVFQVYGAHKRQTSSRNRRPGSREHCRPSPLTAGSSAKLASRPRCRASPRPRVGQAEAQLAAIVAPMATDREEAPGVRFEAVDRDCPPPILAFRVATVCVIAVIVGQAAVGRTNVPGSIQAVSATDQGPSACWPSLAGVKFLGHVTGRLVSGAAIFNPSHFGGEDFALFGNFVVHFALHPTSQARRARNHTSNRRHRELLD